MSMPKQKQKWHSLLWKAWLPLMASTICETEISSSQRFISIQIKLISYEGFALRLVLKLKHEESLKSGPIEVGP